MVENSENRFRLVLPGLLGAFAGLTFFGFCVWFGTVSPAFFPLHYLLYFIPVPVVLGVGSVFLAPMGIAGRGPKGVIMLALATTFIGAVLEFLIALPLETFLENRLSSIDSSALSRAISITLQIGGGLLFLLLFRLLGSNLDDPEGDVSI
jgi:hypothetical protein